LDHDPATHPVISFAGNLAVVAGTVGLVAAGVRWSDAVSVILLLMFPPFWPVLGLWFFLIYALLYRWSVAGRWSVIVGVLVVPAYVAFVVATWFWRVEAAASKSVVLPSQQHRLVEVDRALPHDLLRDLLFGAGVAVVTPRDPTDFEGTLWTEYTGTLGADCPDDDISRQRLNLVRDGFFHHCIRERLVARPVTALVLSLPDQHALQSSVALDLYYGRNWHGDRFRFGWRVEMRERIDGKERTLTTATAAQLAGEVRAWPGIKLKARDYESEGDISTDLVSVALAKEVLVTALPVRRPWHVGAADAARRVQAALDVYSQWKMVAPALDAYVGYVYPLFSRHASRPDIVNAIQDHVDGMASRYSAHSSTMAVHEGLLMLARSSVRDQIVSSRLQSLLSALRHSWEPATAVMSQLVMLIPHIRSVNTGFHEKVRTLAERELSYSSRAGSQAVLDSILAAGLSPPVSKRRTPAVP
jgi:hypothetical protein